MSLIRVSGGWPAVPAPTKHGEWFVLHTRARQEKIVARELNRVGITAYLLIVRQTRQYAQRNVDVEAPLFKQVVFVHGSLQDVRYAMETGRVISIARAMDQVGLQADFEHLSATLPTEAPPVPEAQVPTSFPTTRSLPANLEPHRAVIVRLRNELDLSGEAPKMR